MNSVNPMSRFTCALGYTGALGDIMMFVWIIEYFLYKRRNNRCICFWLVIMELFSFNKWIFFNKFAKKILVCLFEEYNIFWKKVERN